MTEVADPKSGAGALAVDTELTTDEVLIITGFTVVTLGMTYMLSGVRNPAEAFNLTITILSFVIMALVLWGMYTDHEVLLKYMSEHQLLTIIAACVVTWSTVVNSLRLYAVKSVNS
jgi:hypothetical protein